MIPTTTTTTCACCHVPISTGEQAKICPECGTTHHQGCWERNGGCRTAGCRCAQSVAPIDATRISSQARMQQLTPWMIGGAIVLLLLFSAFFAVSLGAKLKTVLVIGVVIAALTFDYVNGMHDAGNAIATVISTRVLTPVAALIMAAVLNLVGALVHAGVATSIATKFADSHMGSAITPVMILCGLIGASSWSFLTARIGLPVSTSHSLFGGLIGVFLLGGIRLNMAYMQKLGIFMVLAPLMAFTVGWALMLLIMWIFRKVAPYKLNQHFRGWQIVSSAFMAFSHGSNDAQKAMGIITMALISGGFWDTTKHAGIPLWVKIACALVIALGTGLGGMRVIKTLGHKIIKLDPVHGFAAETVAATTIQIVTWLGVPISTTHVISSSILGIGASKRLSAVRWGVAMNIMMAWIFTIPTCAAAGALLYWLVSLTGLR